ncbi:MAG: mechanosensitive ion channel domain-containing protein [Opitutaceae bacterium]
MSFNILPLAFLNSTITTVDKWLEYPLLHLGKATFTLVSLMTLAIWIVIVLVLNALIRRLVVRRLLARTHFDAGLQFAVTRIFGYLFVAFGCYVALVASGVDLSSLAVIAGALGVGLGFGLQNIVSNFVSGLILLAERPIAIGDRIEVSGVAGQVRKISMRSTTVVTNDNIAIIVPNSDLTSKPITNWSYGDPKVQFRLPVGVAYGTDLERLETVLLAVARQHPSVLPDPAPSLLFEGFGDSALNFELGVWTQDMSDKPRRFRSALYFAMEKALRENNIEVPFPQRVVQLRPPTPPT